MMKDWGIKLPVTIAMDATTGTSMGSRRGLGKAKHIDICFLWVQEYVENGKIRLKKVGTAEMLADLMTKPLDGGTMSKLLHSMGYYLKRGAHDLVLKAK